MTTSIYYELSIQYADDPESDTQEYLSPQELAKREPYLITAVTGCFSEKRQVEALERDAIEINILRDLTRITIKPHFYSTNDASGAIWNPS